jgi:hypothetical protein
VHLQEKQGGTDAENEVISHLVEDMPLDLWEKMALEALVME